MEPKGNSGAEFIPSGGEYSVPSPRTPEHSGYSPERTPPSPEQQPAQTETAPAAPQTPILPTPVPVATPTTDDSTSVASDDNPTTAADDDLIEKEWVDRAKQIIDQTKDDPHQREVEVGKLQADYLKKRYGKELGHST